MITTLSLLVFVIAENGPPGVAITGNVFVRPALLPPRRLPAPFDTWDGLNTEVPF